MSCKRKMTREINIGGVKIGGNNPIAIQSMCNTDTRDVKSTVEPVSYTHLDVYKRQTYSRKRILYIKFFRCKGLCNNTDS